MDLVISFSVLNHFSWTKDQITADYEKVVTAQFLLPQSAIYYMRDSFENAEWR